MSDITAQPQTASKTNTSPPSLEERFQMPSGWQWGFFENRQGRSIRYGLVLPPGSRPDAIVVGLQGLAEFCEKYFETARDLLARNIGFAMIDWQGHGKSHRLLPDPQKRHGHAFENDVSDLHEFIIGPLRDTLDANEIEAPLVMLAHSMGGNIGLHYLDRHKDIFSAAVFSAPMTGIAAMRFLPLPLSEALAKALNATFGETYVSFVGGGWRPAMRAAPKNDIHSTDPVRKQVHNTWCLYDPALQVGDVTYGWVYHALRACRALNEPVFAAIGIPCFFALAGDEQLVDNDRTDSLVSAMPHGELTYFPRAKHELLMERDEVRTVMLQKLDALVKNLAVTNATD